MYLFTWIIKFLIAKSWWKADTENVYMVIFFQWQSKLSDCIVLCIHLCKYKMRIIVEFRESFLLSNGILLIGIAKLASFIFNYINITIMHTASFCLAMQHLRCIVKVPHMKSKSFSREYDTFSKKYCLHGMHI